MNGSCLSRRLMDTPVGPLLLAATERGLVHVVFHADEVTVRRASERLAGQLGGEFSDVADASSPHIAAAEHQLRAYFTGDLHAFDIPLDWSLSSGFHLRVLRELNTGVPYGTVVGYQDLAHRVGEPAAAQAVGRAMGSNPLPIVVPCHRVIESDGGLGGFGGGLETKRMLLALEGVLPEPLF